MRIEEESTEEKILKAVFDIVEKEGYEKATTKRISTEAGVNEVTIFRKFKNKQTLINAMKDHYIGKFTQLLESIFEYNEEDSVEEYTKKIYEGLLNTPEEEFNVLKVALGEVNDGTERKNLLSKISDAVLTKLWEFFNLKIERNELRDVDANILSVMYYSIIFNSLTLWRIYDRTPDFEMGQYSEGFYDILFNGIKS